MNEKVPGQPELIVDLVLVSLHVALCCVGDCEQEAVYAKTSAGEQ